MGRSRKSPLPRRRAPRKAAEHQDLRLVEQSREEEEGQGEVADEGSDEAEVQDSENLRRLVAIAVAANKTGGSERSICRWAKEGTIHGVMSNGKWRVDLDDVWRYALDSAIRQASSPSVEVTPSHEPPARSPLELAMANEHGENLARQRQQSSSSHPSAVQAIRSETARIQAEMELDEAELERSRLQEQKARQAQRQAEAEDETLRRREQEEARAAQELDERRLEFETRRRELAWAEERHRGLIAELRRERDMAVAALKTSYINGLQRRAHRLSLRAFELADELLDMAVARGVLSVGTAERIHTGLDAYFAFGLDADADVETALEFERTLERVEAELEGYVRSAIVTLHRRLEAA